MKVPETQMTFTSEVNYEGQPKTITTFKTNAVVLSEILQGFEDFLKGSGFSFKGHVDIIEDYEKETED